MDCCSNSKGNRDILNKDILNSNISFDDKCNKLKSIVLTKRQLCDFEMIVNKGFAPLTGFMNEDDYNSCVLNMRLADGSLWTMPIVLAINEETRNDILYSDFITLKHETGLNLGIMDIRNPNSTYKIDLERECEHVYGGFDTNHPYVDILNSQMEDGFLYNVGGPIIFSILPPHYDFADNRLTPEQTKEHFKKNKWDTVVGFQTRNPMHRSHFELTKYALGEAGQNAKLLLHPVIGITQDCDIDYSTRVKCYKKLMKYYDDNSALLSLLPLTMRMAGPREAVWHAQIRKNYGCTHFVVGRDHAGPSYKRKDGSDFYHHYAAQNLFMEHADEIGIKPIVSKMIVYTVPKEFSDTDDKTKEKKGKYMMIDDVDTDKSEILKISGTQQRQMLREGTPIPSWFTFPEIYSELKKSVGSSKTGLCLYFVGLSGSGKSTIANFILDKLKEIASDRSISYLDGDIVRNNLSKGLTFSEADRSINIRRIGYVCSEVVKHGGIAVAANIAPYKKDRQFNKKSISAFGNYVEIFVDTSIEDCEKRDVKGLYKLAREGKIKEFTGISSPFENPTDANITLNGGDKLEDSIETVMKYLEDNKLL
jgi:sulfate adenylyltransferase